RVVLAHHLGDANRCFDVVDGEHEGARLVRLGRFQDLVATDVAVVDLGAEFSHDLDLLGTGVDGSDGDLLGRQDPRHDLPDAADAGDHHVPVVGRNGVEGAG